MLQKIFGAVCVGIAIWSAAGSIGMRREGLTAEGTVVGVRHHAEVSSEGFSLTHAPIVEFVPVGATKPVQFRSDVWTSWRNHSKGDKVTVRYRSNSPEHARVDSVLGDVVLPIVFMVLGVAGLFGRLSGDRQWFSFSKRWED